MIEQYNNVSFEGVAEYDSKVIVLEKVEILQKQVQEIACSCLRQIIFGAQWRLRRYRH